MVVEKALRPILSFVRREGRMTASQKFAFENYWSEFGLDLPKQEQSIDFKEIFQDPTDVILEIGFGMGHSLLSQAIDNPQKQFIGIEVHRPGVGRLLHEIKLNNLKNIRIFRENAIEVLNKAIPDNSLAGLQLFFPDPWHKKKHHKRRIVQASFIELIARKLKPGGFIHFATDWDDYAEHMKAVMMKAEGFTKTNNQILARPETKFERRGISLGHTIHDLIFIYQKNDEVK